VNSFVVWVEFTIRSDAIADFATHVRENAALSLRNEPACRRFDVLVPAQGEETAVALYEIYDSEAAFDAHMITSHYRTFAAATAAMVKDKKVRTFYCEQAS
jgi:(4S)-4-hydroxy-5-phosphonooxypentane-2,3-dione isomerase